MAVGCTNATYETKQTAVRLAHLLLIKQTQTQHLFYYNYWKPFWPRMSEIYFGVKLT